jgi:5-methylcytosine-specific restriction enzyme B
VEVFGGLVEEPPNDQDRYLLAIRERLRNLLVDTHPELAKDDEFDFYREPVQSVWRGGDPEDLAALRFKKQIVLYGPPGTSKTYGAKQLAEGVIRQDALDALGAPKVFAEPQELDEAVKHNTHRLQLHPACSYEDFIRGVAISKDGATEYQPGYLMRLSETIEKERERLGDKALPHVLILDEMNRVDLSRVMGEAFSLLEDRGEEVELAGGDPDKPPATLSLPEDLYIIGTMNLIDQSVEQIDFAMRRRFLWRECRFDENVLIEVLEERWRATGQRTPWERIEPNMYLLVEAAKSLNSRIAVMGVLGERYEVGHTYFLDIVPLLEWQMPPKRASTARHILWHRARPQEPLLNLWDFSLKPLLEQYLAGLDAGEAEDALDQLRLAFLTEPE